MFRKLFLYICLFFSYCVAAQEFDFQADITSGCSPLKVIFKNTTDSSIVNSYTFQWVVESGKYSTQIDSVQNTYISPGKYSVTLSVFDTKGHKVTTITKKDYITVYNDPDVTITADKFESCENNAFNFSIDSLISDTTITSYTWILSDGTSYLTKIPPAHTFGFAGDFDIFLSVTDAHGCSNRERKTITVTTYNDYPSASFQMDKSKACDSKLQVAFTNTSEDENITAWHWDFGDGTSSEDKIPQNHLFSGYGTYYVTLSASSAHECETRYTRSVKLIDFQPQISVTDEFPAVDFNTAEITRNYNTQTPFRTISASEKDVFCIGELTFFDASADENVSWQWDFNSDGTIESTNNSFQVTVDKSGFYSISLTVSNGTCEKKITRTIKVEEPMQLVASPSNAFSCTTPTDITYNVTSSIKGTTFLWSLSDGSISSDAQFTKTFTNEGIYSARIFAISPNYCTSETELTNNVEITIPTLSNTFSEGYARPRSGCESLDVTFQATYTYDTDQDSVKSISWDYTDDGKYEDVDNFSTLSKNGNTTHNWSYDEGVYSYSIVLETATGCKIQNIFDGESDSISVGRIPDVTLSYPTTLCASDELEITVTFDDESRYQSQYDTLTTIFTETAPPPYLEVYEKTDLQTPVPQTFAMNFTDTVGLHEAMFTISDNGCSITKTVDYGVDVVGPMTFIQCSPTNCNSPLIYTYSFEKNFDAESWKWYIQKENEATWTEIANNEDSIVVNFANYGGRGTYWIKATSQNATTGCSMSDSISTKVTEILGEFNLETFEPCLNDTASFLVDAQMGQDIATWSWINNWNEHQDTVLFASQDAETLQITRFDTSPSAKKFKFNSTNITSVSVLVKDIHGCENVISKPVTVYEIHAGFYGDILSDCLPFTTQFTDTSKSDHTIIERIWTFPNNEITGNQTIVQQEFTSKNKASISLQVTDEHGCTDKATYNNYITPVVPNAQFSVVHSQLCTGFEAEFVRNTTTSDYEKNLSHYTWYFGDGESLQKNDNLQDTTKHVYKNPSKNEYEVSLVAYCQSPENHECMDSSSQTIDVKSVGANIVIKTADQCKEPNQKFIVYLDNSQYSTRTKSFQWWKIDGDDSTYVSNKRQLQVVTFENYGTQYLYLNTKSDYYGCEDSTYMLPIQVPGYEAIISADKERACVHEDVTFLLSDTLNLYNYSAYWEFGDGSSQQFESLSVTHQYTALAETENNTYKAQFIVDAPGCKARDISTNVTLFPVIAQFTRGQSDADSAHCSPFSVEIENTSQAGKEAIYTWYINNQQVSDLQSISINKPDSLISISLTVQSSVCNDSICKIVRSFPIAHATIDVDSALCFGESTTATASGDFTELLWEPTSLFEQEHSNTSKLSIYKSQYIYANMKNLYGCQSTDSLFIYVQQKPYFYGAPDSLLLFYNSDGSLKKVSQQTTDLIVGQIYNVNTSGIQGVTYSWSPSNYLSCDDCVSPDINLSCSGEDCLDFPENIEYQIFMTDSLGCFTNDTTIRFSLILDTKLALPEAFTPNEDGTNDIAFVRGWGIQEFIEVKIFNRWGQIVFESNSMAEGWDGTFHGKPQPMDTYSYLIRAINTKGEEILGKGYITLIR